VLNGQRADDNQATAGVRTFWKACHDDTALYFAVRCVLAGPATPDAFPAESVKLLIEPRRLWPCQWYVVHANGSTAASDAYNLGTDNAWGATVHRGDREWSATVRIPLARLRPDRATARPMRIDVERHAAMPAGIAVFSWMERRPLESRLTHGSANPADLGWLMLG
jgi:hypothetical protein